MCHLHLCPCHHVITHASPVMIHSVKGRRMGGNNISAQERICAQCQGKVARFEIVRIKNINYKKITTHTTNSYILFFQHNLHVTIYYLFQLHFTLCIVVQLHCGITVYN